MRQKAEMSASVGGGHGVEIHTHGICLMAEMAGAYAYKKWQGYSFRLRRDKAGRQQA
ncbi:MAG: hypothetical protein JWP84_2337 [Tardiphaga sp.]|nr:hypothetical protein [Tardiphaga sp.]